MYFREYFSSFSSKSYYFYILGVSHLNPCLPSPMHDWAAGAAKLDNSPSQLTKDCQPSDCTEEHYVSLPGMEHMSVELRKNIWLFIYMA